MEIGFHEQDNSTPFSDILAEAREVGDTGEVGKLRNKTAAKEVLSLFEAEVKRNLDEGEGLLKNPDYVQLLKNRDEYTTTENTFEIQSIQMWQALGLAEEFLNRGSNRPNERAAMQRIIEYIYNKAKREIVHEEGLGKDIREAFPEVQFGNIEPERAEHTVYVASLAALYVDSVK